LVSRIFCQILASSSFYKELIIFLNAGQAFDNDIIDRHSYGSKYLTHSGSSGDGSLGPPLKKKFHS